MRRDQWRAGKGVMSFLSDLLISSEREQHVQMSTTWALAAEESPVSLPATFGSWHYVLELIS